MATLAGVASLVLPAATLVRLFAASQFPVYAVLYVSALSGVTFLFYGYDKMQARNLEWRVAETTLQTLALAGGWPGALAGMHYFQHKTRKTRFQAVFWGIVLCWEGVAWVVWRAMGKGGQGVLIDSLSHEILSAHYKGIMRVVGRFIRNAG